MNGTDLVFLRVPSWAQRIDFGPVLLHQICLASLVAILTVSVADAQLTFDVPDGLDAWVTADPGTEIDLPSLPQGLFGFQLGQPSDPLPEMLGFPLESFPCPNLGCDLSGIHTIFGVPNPFPPDQLQTIVTWRDQHGNEVGANSAHNVSSTVQLVEPDPRYNFDTVVRRQGASLSTLGQVEPVEIEMTWLSLKGVRPLTVTFPTAPPEQWDVYIGLSDRGLDEQGTQPVGRMNMQVKRFCDLPLAPCVQSELDMGELGDLIDQLFEQDPTGVFESHPDALGLPAIWQVKFVNQQDPQNPVFITVDDPFGELGLKTTILLHDLDGGELLYVPEHVHGDVNWDFLVNNADIQPFIDALLTGGPGQPLTSQQREALASLGYVPEPSSLSLLGLAGIAMFAWRRQTLPADV